MTEMGMEEFLQKHGWHDPVQIAEDGTPRRYYRVSGAGGQHAVLMESYGPDTHEIFENTLKIGGWMKDVGLRVPEVFAADEARGFMLLEDFGDTSIKKALEGGTDERATYQKMFDLLKKMQDAPCDLDLPDYYKSPVHIARGRVIDWYLPALHERANEGWEHKAYLDLWDKIEAAMGRPAKTLQHMDYHIENLMLLPGGEIGVIDFQDAARGPLYYDLSNLLWDMRTDVSEDLRAHFLEPFGEVQTAQIKVLALQFHCRLIGQCIKWSIEGKPQYLRFLPRIRNYIQGLLKEEMFTPIAQFFDELGLDFTASKDFNADHIKQFIADDAL